MHAKMLPGSFVADHGNHLRPLVLHSQTHKFCMELSHFVQPPLRFALVVGGDAIEEQYDVLARNPDVVVGTPGRLQHVLVDAQLSLSRVE